MFTKIYEKGKNFIKENYKSLIVLILIFMVFTIELPYSIYTPGGAVNLNDRVDVENKENVEGSFNMAYVSMVKGSLPFLLLSKVFPDWDIVKKENITAEGESMDELMMRERLYLQESMDSAIINAYKYVGKDVNIKNVINNVSYISEEAKTDLKVGDQIISVNGINVSSLAELKEIVEVLNENEKVNLKIKRKDKERDAYATTYKIEGVTKIGISFVTTYDYEASPNVQIKSKSTEAGSSGGLMMSLTVYNQLTKTDITKGKKIVGTGTIDFDGNVGEIGGVKYKLIGAVKNKADIFLCPKENYEEAIQVAKDKDYDIKIISASTFEEALKKLEEI